MIGSDKRPFFQKAANPIRYTHGLLLDSCHFCGELFCGTRSIDRHGITLHEKCGAGRKCGHGNVDWW